MPLLSKASNVVQNVSFLYDVTGFTQIGHSIPVATNCTTVISVNMMMIDDVFLTFPDFPSPAQGRQKQEGTHCSALLRPDP